MLFGVELIDIVLRIPALLIAITFHEFAHARMAYHFGDATAKMQGRMSLDPLKHLDPIGSLMILIAGFGWAKPVPINPYNFRNQRSGLLWVSLAGPLANFVLAFLFMLLLFSLIKYAVGTLLVFQLIAAVAQVNILLGVFNLIPIPPLDGSKILTALAPRSLHHFFRQIEAYAPIILLLFILIPTFRGIIIIPFQVIWNAFELTVLFILGLS